MSPCPPPPPSSELIALYLARCRIEDLSPRTQRAYSETLARFQRSVAAQGVPDEGRGRRDGDRDPLLRDLSGPPARHPAIATSARSAASSTGAWPRASSSTHPSAACATSASPPRSYSPSAPAELARLVAACDPTTAVGRRDAAVVLLFLDTGIRCAELSALDLADCDLPRRRLLIRHGKGNKQRVVPFARRCRARAQGLPPPSADGRRARSSGPSPGPASCGPALRLQPNGLKQLLRRRGRAAHVPPLPRPPLSPYLRDLGHPAGRPRTRRPALARPRRPRDGAPLHRQLPRRGRRPPPRPLLARRSDAQGIRVRRTRAPLAPHPACVGPEASLQFPLLGARPIRRSAVCEPTADASQAEGRGFESLLPLQPPTRLIKGWHSGPSVWGAQRCLPPGCGPSGRTTFGRWTSSSTRPRTGGS